MLHASETWPLTSPDRQGLQHNDRAMSRQICNVKPGIVATVRSTCCWLDLRLMTLKLSRETSGEIKTVCDIQIERKRGPGRPKMTWRTHTERDSRVWKLNKIDPCGRDVRDPV